MLTDIFQAFFENLIIVLVPGLLTLLVGMSLIIFLSANYINNANNKYLKWLRALFKNIENGYHYLPFIAVLIILYPFSKKIGNGDGIFFAIIPLTLFILPLFVARGFNILVDKAQKLKEIFSFYSSGKYKTITKIYLPECLQEILDVFFGLLITLVGYSAILGFLGAPGLGKLLYAKGIVEFNITYLLIATMCLAFIIKMLEVTKKSIFKS